jgi:DNA repair and recombination protein RAD52
MEWATLKPLLEAKLDPKHVKKPSGNFGPKGEWIEGWHAIAEANRIFGFGGWSYTIKTLTQDSLKEGTTAKGDMQWQAAYTCIVTVKVGDVVREDVGFGSGFAKQVGDAIEGATKEAVTDALKRTLRTFGNQFGLALYDKSRDNVGVTPPPFDAGAIYDRIKLAIECADNAAKLDSLWANTKLKAALAQLPDDMQAKLQGQYNHQMFELS